VVVNAHDAHAVYDTATIERNLKFPVRVQLPSEPRLVGGSIHRASPLVVTHPDSEIADLLKGLARGLHGRTVPGAEVRPPAKPTGGRRFSLRR
jgi:Flp pilus assembly CpaE family ATPase